MTLFCVQKTHIQQLWSREIAVRWLGHDCVVYDTLITRGMDSNFEAETWKNKFLWSSECDGNILRLRGGKQMRDW